MRYHYSFSHVAVNKLCTADTLSRVPVNIPDPESTWLQQDFTAYVNVMVARLPATKKN